VGGFHGYRSGGRGIYRGGYLGYTPYIYGGYDDNECYWRGRRWVCPYY